MKKVLLSLLSVALLLGGCTEKPAEDTPDYSSGEVIVESAAADSVLDFTENNFKSRIGDVLSEDENCYYFKEIVDASKESYQIDEYAVDLKDPQRRTIPIHYFDDEYGYYSFSAVGDRPGEIGMVDFQNNTHQKLFDLPSYGGEVVAADDRYLVWSDYNYYGRDLPIAMGHRLHLYERETGRDINFFTPNAEIGYWDTTTAVIFGDSVYFSVCGTSDLELGYYHLLCYDIAADSLSTAEEMAQCAIMPANPKQLLFQRLRKSGENELVFSNGTESRTLRPFSGEPLWRLSADIDGSDFHIAFYDMFNFELFQRGSTTSDVPTCDGLQVYADGQLKQILLTETSSLQNPAVCGDYVAIGLKYRNPYVPLLYQFSTDRIIRLDQLPQDEYSVRTSAHYGYFSHRKNGKVIVYRVLLKPFA